MSAMIFLNSPTLFYHEVLLAHLPTTPTFDTKRAVVSKVLEIGDF